MTCQWTQVPLTNAHHRAALPVCNDLSVVFSVYLPTGSSALLYCPGWPTGSRSLWAGDKDKMMLGAEKQAVCRRMGADLKNFIYGSQLSDHSFCNPVMAQKLEVKHSRTLFFLEKPWIQGVLTVLNSVRLSSSTYTHKYSSYSSPQNIDFIVQH